MENPDKNEALLAHPFVKAALDPTLIPGIYDTCDQWCMYCPATDRCLAYRCRPPETPPDVDPPELYANIAERMVEGMLLLRELTAAEGRVLPELEALLAADPRGKPEFVPVDDPLERLGRRYAIVSSRYLESHPQYPFVMRKRADGPTPFEVFAWYHVLIAAKIYRAITSRLAAARTGGDADLSEDARFSAKTALLGIDRSRQALASLMTSDEDARLADMDAQLRRLRREVDARFPEARDVVRPGLDAVPDV